MSSAPVSLYLDLKPGEKADLEVVARASIAFAQAIKGSPLFLDPSIEIRIELASGTEGSLSLNSILKSIKTADGKDITLAAVGSIVLFWFGNHVLDWTFDKVMDIATGKPEPAQVELHLAPEDMKSLQGMVDKAITGHIAQEHVQQVYRELEADPSITGVGATRVPEKRPETIIPRSEFPARSGTALVVIPEIVTTHREPVTRQTLVLIRPVLLTGNRRWRFSGRHGEFGAPVLDDEFLQNLVAGKVPVQMGAGIEMDVDLQAIEEKQGGVWVPVAYNILKVHGVRPAPSQQVLNLPSPPPKGDGNE